MSDTTSDPGSDAGPPQPMPGAGAASAPPGGPPGGGPSPVLAALARNRMQAQPTQPGMGSQAGALQKVAMAIDLLQQALPGLGIGSQQHNGVLNAIRQLSRHAGEGAVTAGAGQTALQDMLRNQARNAMLQRLLAQRGGGGSPGMSPSTPMPGA